MKKYVIFIYFFYLVYGSISAQTLSAKVDINMEGRTATEVNEPGYTPWFIARVNSASISISGITFTLTATGPTITSTMRAGWSKALVQTPYFSRLVNDGVKVDNDTMLNHPGMGAKLELRISGLPVGKHTIQTFHNIWEDTLTINYCPMNVYLNGILVHSNIKRSIKTINPTSSTILLTEFDVIQPGQEMVLSFEPEMNFNPVAGKKADYNITINAFELNTDDASKQAREPYPASGDMHVDSDTGSLMLKWKPAINGYTQSHIVYFGTDSSGVANAVNIDATYCKGTLPYTTQEFKVENLYNLNVYYWRIDQTDSSGLTTKGKVWNFRPRHLAFRGAEGYGRYAIGGRGGKVVYVTNLNDAGPGSFREAVTANIGPRTVIFNVSGIIALSSRLSINSKYITIAGQTAPGKGICFRSAPLGLGSEAICRYVRMRLGAGATYDGIGMAGADNSILDHASISWTIDEAFSSRGAKSFTLQRTLISEALNVAGHQNYPEGTAHGYAGSIGGDIGSFHHNLLAHCEGRNWSLAGGLDGNGYYAGRLDIFNSVVYNWGGRATDGGAHEVNFVNNYYKKGAATTQNTVLKAQIEGTGKGSQSYFYSGNILENTNGTLACDGTNNSCSRTYVLSNGQVLDWTVFVAQPFFPSYANIQTAKGAYKSVLSDVGCNLPLFDEHDQRIVTETKTGTYTYTGSYTGKKGLIDHQDDAGGYEDYPEETRPANFDVDMDGLPNWWENLHGSNPNSTIGDFSDSNADPDKDGYTALEDYLEWMSVPRYFMNEGTQDTIELSGYFVGYTKSPVYSCSQNIKFTLLFNGSLALIRPKTDSKGIHYFDFKVTDTDGDSLIRRMGICVGGIEPTMAKEMQKWNIIDRIKVYPTCFDNLLNIDLDVRNRKLIEVKLTDLSGREVFSKDYYIQNGYNKLQFVCPKNITSRVYVLKVTDKQSFEVLQIKKVIKK